MIKKTCGFTGYRPHKLPFDSEESPRCKLLKAAISRAVMRAIDDGYSHFICGFAPGSDMYFAEAVLEAKKECPHIILESALPCETQANKWREEVRRRYFDLLAKCDKETCISHSCKKDCYLKRNDYMLNKADRIIAVYDGKRGGTMYTVNRAKRMGKELIVIEP